MKSRKQYLGIDLPHRPVVFHRGDLVGYLGIYCIVIGIDRESGYVMGRALGNCGPWATHNLIWRFHCQSVFARNCEVLWSGEGSIDG